MKKSTLNQLRFILCSFILLFALPCFASTLKINDTLIETSVPPLTENGTTLVPLRLISEHLGATVDYKAGQIQLTQADTVISLTLGKKEALVNGKSQSLASAPKVVKNTTMVPLRFISENLNCQVNWDSKTQQVLIQTATLPIATLTIKDYGTVTLELYPDMAPNTVNNFIALANKGFYDGLIFHRIIDGFMLQGGDPLGTGTGGPGYAIAGEFSSNDFTANTLSHTKGVISMARSMFPDSAGSQFFIMAEDHPYLDGQYAAFGKVTSGLELIEALQHVETNSSDKPLTNVVIESLRVNTQGISYAAPETL